MERGYLIILIFISILGCRGNFNVLNHRVLDENIVKPTLKIDNYVINEIIDYLENQDEFDSWTKSQDKLLFLSILENDKNEYLIRAIPSFRKKYAMPLLDNNYKGYAFDKNALIIVWGDERNFFKRIGNKNKKIFDSDELEKIAIGEYYGSQFIIKNNQILSSMKQYFESPLFKSGQFLN